VRTRVSTSASIDIALTYVLLHLLRYRHPSTPIPISSCARLYTSTPIKVDAVVCVACRRRGRKEWRGGRREVAAS
jgi:hypothetical protein